MAARTTQQERPRVLLRAARWDLRRAKASGDLDAEREARRRLEAARSLLAAAQTSTPDTPEVA